MSNIESIKKTNLKIERAFKQLNKILTNSKIKEIVKNPEEMIEGMRMIQDSYFKVSKIVNSDLSKKEKKKEIEQIMHPKKINLGKKEVNLLVSNNKKGGAWMKLSTPKAAFITKTLQFFDIRRFTRILFSSKLKKSDKLEKVVKLTPYPIIFTGNPVYRRFKAIVNDLHYTDVFFPLHVGSVMSPTFDIGLDIMGMGLDMSQMMLTAFTPILEMGTKAAPIAIDAVQAVPGYGTAVAPIAMAVNLYNMFGDMITGAIEGFGTYVGLLYNIARKEWTLAFIAFTSFIPNYTVHLDFFITMTKAFNKTVQRMGFNPSIIHPVKKIHTKLNIFLGEFLKFITKNLHLLKKVKIPDLSKIRKKIFKI
jgi:hypothetical protein